MKNLKSLFVAILLAFLATALMTMLNLHLGQSGPLPFPLYQEKGILDAFRYYGVGVEQTVSAWFSPENPTPEYWVKFHLPSAALTWPLLALFIFLGIKIYHRLKNR